VGEEGEEEVPKLVVRAVCCCRGCVAVCCDWACGGLVWFVWVGLGWWRGGGGKGRWAGRVGGLKGCWGLGRWRLRNRSVGRLVGRLIHTTRRITSDTHTLIWRGTYTYAYIHTYLQYTCIHLKKCK
jgi:hypothetical protein